MPWYMFYLFSDGASRFREILVLQPLVATFGATKGKSRDFLGHAGHDGGKLQMLRSL